MSEAFRKDFHTKAGEKMVLSFSPLIPTHPLTLYS
jgi:hypothetical protein